jgi:phosphoribosylformylglycinamidine (FGAM) synthase-like enzyme
MESHNHPSYIEPYQGATTGVGGILRDVFTMGARPIACSTRCRFGAPDHPKTRHLVSGVVAGVGGYGNSFGVPNLGGATGFHSRYDGNILVNAMAVGSPRRQDLLRQGLGREHADRLSRLQDRPRRHPRRVDGFGCLRRGFGEKRRPTVQVGDPFAEKLLLEACLEIMAAGLSIAIQDMGAAGLTCSAVEMGAKGDLGVELNLDAVPTAAKRA